MHIISVRNSKIIHTNKSKVLIYSKDFIKELINIKKKYFRFSMKSVVNITNFRVINR